MILYKGPFNAAYLRSILCYSPATGHWHWVNPPNKRMQPGARTAKPAKDGVCNICILGRQYRASRLAWLYMTGRWPTKFIDHKDGDSTNERWSNLRQASRTQNLANSRLCYRSKSGYKGVTQQGNRFCAKVGKTYLGMFATVEEASAAYAKAARKRWGEFARVR